MFSVVVQSKAKYFAIYNKIYVIIYAVIVNIICRTV
jgi:hypothetical protein